MIRQILAPGNTARFFVKSRRWVILAMLLSLHAGLVSAPGSEYQRVWLLVHFGFFLLWQPFIATDQELKRVAVLLIFAITAVTIYFLSGWMLVSWLTILIGILGGKVFTQQASRRSRFYLVAAFYLFTALLVWAVPVLLLGIESVPQDTRTLVRVFLPLVLLLLAALPFEAQEEAQNQVFDFFYSLFVFQLVMALGLGSIALMRATGNEYYTALLLTVTGFAAALLVLAVLWGPRTGFGGLRTYFSRYLMSVGMPFELWMRRIAELAEADLPPAQFLSAAMEEIARVPSINGAHWSFPEGAGAFGDLAGFPVVFKYHDVEITFHTEIRLSPALFLHVRLLAQVVGEFYEGKRREEVLRQNAYMQAVHETGARMTHDIKNLLQSLYALTSANVATRGAGAGQPERRANTAYDSMLERQLPQLTKRLQSTLDKLQNPEESSAGVSLPAADWWTEVKVRYRDGPASFSGAAGADAHVPATLFDAVLENCVENARRKLVREPGIAIEVAFETHGGDPLLSITDTGSPLDPALAEDLFRAPTQKSAAGGYGIGLFQASRSARQAGFELSLADNRAGRVRFELRRSSSATVYASRAPAITA